MFSKIMVPVDGSEHSKKALDYAIKLGKMFSSEIVLIHVVQQPIFPFSEMTTSTFIDKVIEGLMENARRIINAAKDTVKREGLRVVDIIKVGQPAEVIISEAEKLNVNLIVIGSKGVSKVKRFLLGSISDAVVHHAKCPVLIVK